MVQLHAIMGGLDVRPATDADLLGALILKSATYQADHAGYGDRVWFLVVFSTAGNLDPRCRGYDPWGSRTLRGVSTGGVESFVVFP